MHNRSSYGDGPAGRGPEYTEIELFSDTATSPFDAIRHEDEDGEHWFARELMPHLGYAGDWRNFVDVIAKAKTACAKSGYAVQDHFGETTKMVAIGSGAKRSVPDFRLTRYACYLIAQNGDSRKQSIAHAQTYFAAQTRKQEIAQQATMASLPDTSTPEGVLAIVDMLRDQVVARMNDAKTIATQATRIKALEPAEALMKTYAGARGLTTKRAFARDVQQWALDQGYEVSQQQVFDFLHHIGLFIRSSTSEHDQAMSQAIKDRKAKNVTIKIEHSDGTIEKRKYGKLTAKGEDYAWRRIHDALEQHGTLDLDVIKGTLVPATR